MKYVHKEPSNDNPNVSEDHPIRGFIMSTISILTGLLLFIFLTVGILDFLAGHIPARWEMELSKFLRGKFTQNSDLEKSEASQVIRTITQELVEKSDLKAYDFQVFLHCNPEPNAFAVPGGIIVVTTGLLKHVQSRNGLAMVIAHELGHFSHKHHLKGLLRGLVFSVLGGTLFSQGMDSLNQFIAQVFNLSLLSFSREQERQSDDYGLDLLNKTYQSTAQAEEFFIGIQKAYAFEKYIPGFFQTHPTSSERINTLKQKMKGPESAQLLLPETPCKK